MATLFLDSIEWTAHTLQEIAQAILFLAGSGCSQLGRCW